jgi:hypothetical protein
MPARPQDDKLDTAVEDSFPASDPPATRSRPAPHEREEDSRPQEPRQTIAMQPTAHQWEDEEAPRKR